MRPALILKFFEFASFAYHSQDYDAAISYLKSVAEFTHTKLTPSPLGNSTSYSVSLAKKEWCDLMRPILSREITKTLDKYNASNQGVQINFGKPKSPPGPLGLKIDPAKEDEFFDKELSNL